MNYDSNLIGITSLIFAVGLIFLIVKTINYWSYNGV